MQEYPHISFQKNWRLDEETIFMLGQCEAIIQAISSAPVKPEYRKQLMVEGCAINGNPKPELKEITGAFVVKFSKRPASEGINGGAAEEINRLVNYIRSSPGRNVKQITTALNLPQRTIERRIKKLREQGKIVFTGSRKTGGYFPNK